VLAFASKRLWSNRSVILIKLLCDMVKAESE
jgi:hypothetical protein